MADVPPGPEPRPAEWRKVALSLLAHALLLGWAGFSLWLLTDYLVVRPGGEAVDLAQRRDLVAAGSVLVLAVTVVAARLMWTTFSRGGPEVPKNAGQGEGLSAVDHLAGAVDHLAEQMHAHMADLSVQALRDPLTRLPNRALFMDAMRRALARARRQGTDVAVLYIDLDDFKSVNDQIGHLAGDAVLAEAADRVRDVVRSADIACRIGGDEFAVILPESSITDADQLYRRLEQAVSARPVGHAGRLHLSAGVTELRPDDDATSLFERADEALYRAKGAGKGTVVAVEAATSFPRQAPGTAASS